MPLTRCRDCGKEVSTEAAACPHCGADAPARTKSPDWVQCPHCSSPNTRRIGLGLLGCVSLLVAGGSLLIPIVWVLVPVFLLALLGVFFWIWAFVPQGRVSFQCQACKRWFAVAKSHLPTK
jgi:DNA-directed RNA polymerase subunit RPC12/RpoP